MVPYIVPDVAPARPLRYAIHAPRKPGVAILVHPFAPFGDKPMAGRSAQTEPRPYPQKLWITLWTERLRDAPFRG